VQISLHPTRWKGHCNDKMNIEIKKGKGIEGLVKPSHSEIERSLDTEGSLSDEGKQNVFQVLADFEKHVASADFNSRSFTPIYAYVPSNVVNHVLTPAELRIADHMIIASADKQEKSDADVYIIRLVQNSYDAGHNGFIFDIPHWHIGANLKGTKENPIQISVNELGSFSGERSDYVHFQIKGNAESNIGTHSRYCKFIIGGDLGHSSGSDAESIFDIKGDIHTGWMYFGYNVLKIHREETLEKIMKASSVDYHKLIRVHPDGTEELIKEKKRRIREEPDHYFGFAP